MTKRYCKARPFVHHQSSPATPTTLARCATYRPLKDSFLMVTWPQFFFCLPCGHCFILGRLLWWNRLTTCTVIPSLSSTATIINNIIISLNFSRQHQEKLLILQTVSPGGDGPSQSPGSRGLNLAAPAPPAH